MPSAKIRSDTRSSPSETAIRYHAVRGFTEQLCEPLETEDFVVQSMPDVSPTRWHLAHTTWFFETFLLAKCDPRYRRVNPAFEVLFNSYYNSVGEPFLRARRGLLSRPTVREVFDYRRVVDERMQEFIQRLDPDRDRELLAIVELGLQHEQQHQELMLTDIKHVLSCNPLLPTYQSLTEEDASTDPASFAWLEFPAGLVEIGHRGAGFAYDNESPRHKTYLNAYQLGHRLITNGEYLQFMHEDGYKRPELWLSLGWSTVQEQGWRAPLYWLKRDAVWCEFTLHGARPVRAAEPVTHVSFFEADAFARWAQARLPTEAEWEVATGDIPLEGNFVERKTFHPRPASDTDGQLAQLFGDVWEWTASPYVAYPGYTPPAGALGEYNGKFMCNQFVLRGGSCATSETHMRPTYRNFFPPDARWQFTGIRLAR